MEQVSWRNVCCNPFNKPGHYSMKKNLRPVLSWMIDVLPSVKADGKICDSCRKQLTLLIVKPSSLDNASVSTNEEPLDESCDNPCNDADDDYACPLDLESINECLKGIGETPVIKKKLVHKSYTKDKLSKIKIAAAKAVLPTVMLSKIDDGHEIIEQLKEKFCASTERSQKIEILTILPKSWSVNKIQEEFLVTNYMARTAKNLVKKKRDFVFPKPKAWMHLIY